MEKTLKPFVVFTTYVALYCLTYSAAAAFIALTFWINYIEIVQNPVAVVILLLTVGCHLTLKLSDSKL